MGRDDKDVVIPFGQIGGFAVLAVGGVGFLAVGRGRRWGAIHCRDEGVLYDVYKVYYIGSPGRTRTRTSGGGVGDLGGNLNGEWGSLLVDYFKRDGMSDTDASRRIGMFSAAWQALRQPSPYSGQLGGQFVLHGWFLPGGNLEQWSFGYVDPKTTRPPVLRFIMVEMKTPKRSRPRETATSG